MAANDQPISDHVQAERLGAALDPPSKPLPPSVAELLNAVNNSDKETEKATEGAKKKEEGLKEKPERKFLISEREILISEPFLTVSKVLYLVLACSALILVAAALADRWFAKNPDDRVAFLVFEIVVWMVVPFLALLIGYYSGIRSRESHSRDSRR
jgi:hypothetical protein